MELTVHIQLSPFIFVVCSIFSRKIICPHLMVVLSNGLVGFLQSKGDC